MIGIVKDVYREFEDGEWIITGTGCSLGKITVREIESEQIIKALMSSEIIRKNKIVSVKEETWNS